MSFDISSNLNSNEPSPDKPHAKGIEFHQVFNHPFKGISPGDQKTLTNEKCTNTNASSGVYSGFDKFNDQDYLNGPYKDRKPKDLETSDTLTGLPNGIRDSVKKITFSDLGFESPGRKQSGMLEDNVVSSNFKKKADNDTIQIDGKNGFRHEV
jgi:hypothetical protein